MKRLVVLIVLLATAGAAHAVSRFMEFTGAASANWNDPSNWCSLDYAQQKKTPPFAPAATVPFVADQVMIRDGRTVTVDAIQNEGGTYLASYMGTVSGEPPSYVFNGAGAVEYYDNGDPNKILYAGGGTIVMTDPNAILSQGSAKDFKDWWVVGGVYGGEMVMSAGTLEPDYYMSIGHGGGYTYTGMRIDDPNSEDPDDTLQDPNYVNITPVGRLTMNGGTLWPCFALAKGTKTRTYIGYAGGNGTLIINDGYIPTREFEGNKKSVQLNVGLGSAGNASNGATWGYMEFNGGSMAGGENLAAGYDSGKGKIVVTGGSFDPGGDLQIGYCGRHTDYAYSDTESLSYGEVVVKGNAVMTANLLTMAQGNSGGTLTIQENAKFRLDSAKTDLANENAVGRSMVFGATSGVAGTVVACPTGVVNVEGGTFQSKPGTSNTTRGTFRLGWTWDNRSASSKDPTFSLPTFSRGEMNLSGGMTLFEVGGTSTVTVGSAGAPVAQYIVLGSSVKNEPNSNATGVINITGGSFITVGGSARLYDDPSDPNTYAGDSDYAGVHIILAQHKTTTGIMNIGRNAYVKVDGNFTMRPGNEVNSSAKLIVDYDDVKTAVLNLTGVATLADTLVVNSTGYRLREGDKLVVIKSTDPCANYYSGDFATISTNITTGAQYVGNDPNNGTLAFWAGNKNAGDYEAIFQGRTAGDCVGAPGVASAVDGGDLAIMGGNWNTMGGMTWNSGDFNGDGNVDGGDLALMGGNWNWTLPSPAPGAIPEPATLALIGLGVVAVIRRKR